VACQIVWSDSALDRIIEFLDFIAEENPEAAQRVIAQLFNRVGVLAEQPRAGRRLSEDSDPDLHRFVAGKYIVVYRLQEARQTVTIVAVRHSRERSLPQEEA
jgi:toxin ParE1/3/4